MRVLLSALALLIALTASVHAEEKACSAFKWPLATEKSWFETDKLASLASGAAVATLAEDAFTVTLAPSAGITFKLKPEGKEKPGKPLGAIVSFDAVATPGRYQVTLSDEAWIDIVQDGKYRPSGEFTGVHGCPGLRKSVRFELAKGPLILQLSSASAAEIKVAIRAVKIRKARTVGSPGPLPPDDLAGRAIRKSGGRFSVRARAQPKIPITFITSSRSDLK